MLPRANLDLQTQYIHSKTLLPNPAPERVPEGRTIQLPCVPPDADPKPEIIWCKDGQEISGHSGTDSIADSNLILASDGSLIISATRLSDSANYSCEAWNIANRRTTPVVQLLVYAQHPYFIATSGHFYGDGHFLSFCLNGGMDTRGNNIKKKIFCSFEGHNKFICEGKQKEESFECFCLSLMYNWCGIQQQQQ
uniref:Ig-like domain-containing protein n=1 Tax=Ditylenchus dipsaci TaxID=166011 RepID=A0A915CWZ2_9BILA